jgi:hypothetical protein
MGCRLSADEVALIYTGIYCSRFSEESGRVGDDPGGERCTESTHCNGAIAGVHVYGEEKCTVE